MSLFSRMVRRFAPWGGYALARQLCRNEPRILMYHRFSDPPVRGWTSPAFFEAQVRHIRRHYQPMTLASLMQHRDRTGSMPPHAVVVTVDDGYRDFYQLAFPILRHYGVPATLYATSGFVDQRLWLWPDKVTWLLSQVHSLAEPLQRPGFSTDPGVLTEPRRRQLWHQLIHHLLSLPDAEKHRCIESLYRELKVSLPEQAPAGFEAMSWDQLREVQEAGIEVGGHTQTHPSLGQVSDTQAREEIHGCHTELIRQLGPRPRTFCYPNGQPGDLTPRLQPLVAEAGFLGAVTAFPDALGCRHRYALRRHVSGDDMFQFHKSVSGLEYLGHRLRRNVRMTVGTQGQPEAVSVAGSGSR
ncbi:MAG: polysaccharide deacetylase family protein [Oleiphilaceae bacterium]|nr:polysaccharide deacetylase family protein [Oleiphilaceae bacterium]